MKTISQFDHRLVNLPRLKRRQISIACAVMAASLVSGCSPYVFSNNVSIFSTEVGAIKTAYQDAGQKIVSEQQLFNHIVLLQFKPLIFLSPGCGKNPLTCALLPDSDVVAVAEDAVTAAKSAKLPDVQIALAQEIVDKAKAIEVEEAQQHSNTDKTLPKTNAAFAAKQVSAYEKAADVAMKLQNAIAAVKPAPKPNPVESCQIEGSSSQMAAAKIPNPEKLPAPQTAGLFSALDNYGTALAALTNAQDRADFDKASSTLSTAVGGLTGGVALASGAAAPVSPAVTALADTSSNMLLWLIGQDLDYRRLKKLKLAVNTACQPIHTLADALGGLMDDQRVKRQDVLKELLREKIRAVNGAKAANASDQVYGAALDDAQAAAAAYQAVKASNPLATAQELSGAHDKLIAAVNNNDDKSFSDLATSLQQFATLANSLTTAAAANPTADKSK